MTKQEFTQAMTILGIAYNKEFTPEQIEVWYEFFYDTSFDVFNKAIKRVIPKSEFIPSIARLRGEIAQITNPMLQLNVDDEWTNVINQIRKHGTYITAEEFNKFNETTLKVVKTIGWRRLCLSENIEFERRTFYDMFKSYQKRSEDVSLVQLGALMENEKLMLGEGQEKNPF